MKKLISILMALSMLFTFAAIPSMAEETNEVDFTAVANIANAKAVTTIVAEGEAASIAEATDADITTAYTSAGATAFYVDFAAAYEVDEITLYLGTAGAAVNVYAGNAIAENNLIGKATAAAEAVVIGETSVYPATVSADGIIAQYLTFEYAGTSSLAINEIYVDTLLLDGDWNIALGGGVSKTYNTYGVGNACASSTTWKLSDASNKKPIYGLTDGIWSSGSLNGATGKTANANTNYFLVMTLDLGAYYNVEEIRLYQVSTNGKKFDAYLGHNSIINEWSTIGSDKRKIKASCLNTESLTPVVRTSSDMSGKVFAVSRAILDKPDVARYITIAYNAQYTNYLYEIAVVGTPVTGTVVDFRSEDNLAYSKATVTGFSGTWWGSGEPHANNRKATDGFISTNQTGTGKYMGGLGFKLDLGAYYNISEISCYTTYENSPKYNIYAGKLSKTGEGTNTDRVKYIDEVGEVATPLVTVPAATEKTKVNGVDVWAVTNTFPEGTEPVRYLYVSLDAWSTAFSELLVKGTPVAELESGNAIYSYDSEAGKVKANLIVANGSETAETGKLYFAAYNTSGELVGISFMVADLGVAGVYDDVVTFAVSEEPAYVKAFYWADKLIPVTEPISFK